MWRMMFESSPDGRPATLGRLATRVTALAVAGLIGFPTHGQGSDSVWVEQGPGPAVVDWGLGYTEVSGAVNVIAPHPTDPNTVFIAATNGGIWRTNNALDKNPNWVPLTDHLRSLSVGALAFSPLDASHNTLYAGFCRSGSTLCHGVQTRCTPSAPSGSPLARVCPPC